MSIQVLPTIQKETIAGRIGKGLGQGLSEQLPKEAERYRLSQGLKNLGQKQNLNPFQQFSELAGLPGTTPQIIQSGSELLRQQAYLDAIKNQYEGQGGPKAGRIEYTPSQQDLNAPVKGEIPTLADPESTAQSYREYIPPSEQEERQDAYENFNKNPARYNYDFNNALKERKDITTRNQEIQKAYQTQESTAVGKEEKVKKALSEEVKNLKLNNIPPKAYQKFEEKVLNSILPKKDGGKGYTQEQAIKNYSKELDQANRNYLDLGSLSTWSPSDFNRRVNALQKDFAEREEQQMMMDQLISDYGISPLYAAHKAYPIKKGQIPTIDKFERRTAIPKYGVITPNEITDATYAQLKKEMGKNISPLSVAYEIQQNGRDPRGFLEYLNNNRDNLEVWQADQLSKNINIFDLKDMWLKAWE